MTARFVACLACGRHVKEGDVACPFCGADAPSVGPLPRLAGGRMTRAAMIAAGTAGTVAGIFDCGQTSSPTAFYGVPCTGNECIPSDQDSAPPLVYDGSSAVFYGVACTGDACSPGIDEDSGRADASEGDATDAADAADAAQDAQTDGADASED
ncbi:MAG: hypothetical protein ACLQVI_13230 [Polyangiaceae bacterium]|jgi:hypothetical protein